jgi:hypothetical protein
MVLYLSNNNNNNNKNLIPAAIDASEIKLSLNQDEHFLQSRTESRACMAPVRIVVDQYIFLWEVDEIPEV